MLNSGLKIDCQYWDIDIIMVFAYIDTVKQKMDLWEKMKKMFYY
jgi:hypothetical protein